MKILRKGDEGAEVEHWQFFLVGQELLDEADGIFGPNTKAATIEFQRDNQLTVDGIVGNKTYGAAMLYGFELIEDHHEDKHSAWWPPKPDFGSLYNDEDRFEAFGKFEYKADDSGRLEILDDWEEKNIIKVKLPQLVGIDRWGRPHKDGVILFHKKAAEQLKGLWAEWEKRKLMPLVRTYSGSYWPRFIRGSKTKLSNHAFGSAFDINFAWNKLGRRPALVGQEGSVRELVPIANEFGFYWGGHFRRKDGMHFEIAKLL